MCRAVAIPGPGSKAHHLKKFALQMKSGHLAFKIVMKKGKIEKC